MYKSCLQRLGCDTTARVNKEHLVFQIPGLQCYNKGRDVYLGFRDDVEFALHKVHGQDCDEKAMHLAKTAAIVRKDIYIVCSEALEPRLAHSCRCLSRFQ